MPAAIASTSAAAMGAGGSAQARPQTGKRKRSSHGSGVASGGSSAGAEANRQAHAAPAKADVKGKGKAREQAPQAKMKRRQLKRSEFEEQLQALRQQADDLVSDPSASSLTSFEELPLSLPTQRGLRKAGFTSMTAIQRLSLPQSLHGRDVLAAAPTGSGKTLAFLIPVLERLYHLKWGGQADGLGALILLPTRELAIQIFDVLRKIGSFHTSLSAGLVIGGKDVKQEQSRLARINILVATPGRLLQHMDQTASFDTSNLQVLVLDEADRCLDMGFENTLNAILENLPRKSKASAGAACSIATHGRQTLLFSATQTKKVRDLARLSLAEPEYVAVGRSDAEGAQDGATGASSSAALLRREQLLPKQLEQHYMLVSLNRKLDVLYSFIRTHVQSKLLIFFSSCRQVQYAFDVFCKLRPGVPLLSLHGKQKQAKRLQIYSDFSKSKHACLLATDIAARGLDFPSVDWVVQADAPEDAETYVHRVGRTARYDRKGSSLLFLMPGAERDAVLTKLAAKGIVDEDALPAAAAEDDEEASGLTRISAIKAKEAKIQSIANQLQAFLFQDPQLKYLAQKAFVSYVRSLHLQQKSASLTLPLPAAQGGAEGAAAKVEVPRIDVTELPLEKYAESLGLAGAPKIKFVKEARKAKAKEAKLEAKAAKLQQQQKAGGVAADADAQQEQDAKAGVKTKYDRMFNRQNEGVLSEHYQKLVKDDEDEDDSNDESDSAESSAQGARRNGKAQEAAGSDESGSEEDYDSDDGFGAGGDRVDDGDDFLTLKRADHGLEGDSDSEDEPAVPSKGTATLPAGEAARLLQKKLDAETQEALEANRSKRSLRMGQSKKAMANAGKRGQGEKLVFDDEGQAHALYELQGESEFRAAGDVQEQAREYEQRERERLRESDVLDKERMREKRREKKRKQKERERAENGDLSDDDGADGDGAVELAPMDEDDDWQEPDWVLPGDEIDDADEAPERPSKKTKKPSKGPKASADRSLAQDEELALQLLGGA